MTGLIWMFIVILFAVITASIECWIREKYFD